MKKRSLQKMKALFDLIFLLLRSGEWDVTVEVPDDEACQSYSSDDYLCYEVPAAAAESHPELEPEPEPKDLSLTHTVNFLDFDFTPDISTHIASYNHQYQ